ASWTPVTRSSSSSTISTSSSPRTTASTSVPRAATRAERSSLRGRRRWWPRRPARTPASSWRRCSQSSTARTVACDRACLLRLDRRRRRVPCPLRRLRRPVLVRRLLRRAPAGVRLEPREPLRGLFRLRFRLLRLRLSRRAAHRPLGPTRRDRHRRALPRRRARRHVARRRALAAVRALRSEEHTSELQSRFDLVCRLMLEIIKIKVLLHLNII